MVDPPVGGDAGAVATPAAPTASAAPTAPAAPTEPTAPTHQPQPGAANGPARAPTQQQLIEVHRRARELIALMRERSAGGKSKSDRYKAHDTARKHVLGTIVS